MRRFARMLSAPRRAARKKNRTMPLASTTRSVVRKWRSPLATCAGLSRSDANGSASDSRDNVSPEVGGPSGLRDKVGKTFKPKATPLVDGEFRLVKVAGPDGAVRRRVHGL